MTSTSLLLTRIRCLLGEELQPIALTQIVTADALLHQ
jgi:hypothetical protein